MWYVIGLAIGGIIMLAVSGWRGIPNLANTFGFQDHASLWIMVPLSVLIIGPGEELLFRGVVQSMFREVFRSPIAITAASVLYTGFAALSFGGGSGQVDTWLLLLALTVFFPVLVIGTAYDRTNNILVPALIHGTYSALMFAHFTLTDFYKFL